MAQFTEQETSFIRTLQSQGVSQEDISTRLNNARAYQARTIKTPAQPEAKTTSQPEQGFFSGVAQDLSKRGEQIMDVAGRQAGGQTGFVSGALQQAGNIAGGLTDVAGRAISAVTPDIVKEGAKSVAGGIGNLSDVITGQEQGTTNKEALQALGMIQQKHEELKQKYPNAVGDIDALANMVGLYGTLAGGAAVKQVATKAIPKVGEALGSVGTKLETAGVKQATEQATKKAVDLVTPELSAKKTAEELQLAAKSGRLEQGGIIQGAKVEPNMKVNAMAQEVSKLPVTGSDFREDLNIIATEQNATAEQLGGKLKQVALSESPETIGTAISNNVENTIKNSLVSADAQSYTRKIMNEFRRILSTKPINTADDLWKARIELDNFVKGRTPSITKMGEQETARQEAWNLARNDVNEYIKQIANKEGVGDAWNKWSQLQDAGEIVAQKAAKQSSSSIGRAYDAVKGLLDIKGSIAAGATAAGIYATGTTPILAGLGILGGTGYGAYKLVTSPSLKKALGSLLKNIEKALPKATPEVKVTLQKGKKEIQLLLRSGEVSQRPDLAKTSATIQPSKNAMNSSISPTLPQTPKKVNKITGTRGAMDKPPKSFNQAGTALVPKKIEAKNFQSLVSKAQTSDKSLTHLSVDELSKLDTKIIEEGKGGYALSPIHKDGTIELTNVFTAPDFRGQGIGSKVMESAINDAKQKGAFSIRLDAYKYLEPFYEKFGFKTTHEVKFDPKFSNGFDPRKLGKENRHNIVYMKLDL